MNLPQSVLRSLFESKQKVTAKYQAEHYVKMVIGESSVVGLRRTMTSRKSAIGGGKFTKQLFASDITIL